MAREIHGIGKWAVNDRPREKLLHQSPQALSDAELVAILIGGGTPDHNAVELAREVLHLAKQNLPELGKVSVRELMTIKGIGQVKAITIVAAMELSRRRQASACLARPLVRDTLSVATYLQSLFQDLYYEVFAVLYLTRAGRIKDLYIHSQGGITGTIADPRLILKKAIEQEAVSIILCHNHPSGCLWPSTADEELTVKIREGAKLLDIKLLDHIIVSEEGYYSFADQGKLSSQLSRA